MSLFLPSQLSPNFEEVLEGTDLRFKFLVNASGSYVTSYKLEILNENNDAPTPDDNILYTQKGDFDPPLYDGDEGIVIVDFIDIQNILQVGFNYRWRIRLYNTKVNTTDLEDIQSNCLTYMSEGNLLGTTKNVIWLKQPNSAIKEETFAGVYLASDDFNNDFKPFRDSNTQYISKGSTGSFIGQMDGYSVIPTGFENINQFILPQYQDKLFDGNMYLQFLPVGGSSSMYNIDYFMPHKILSSTLWMNYMDHTQREFAFCINIHDSLPQLGSGSYCFRLLYLERQQVYDVTQSVGFQSLTKIETDKPFTYNISHNQKMNFGLVSSDFSSDRLYIHPVDEFDSKDVGNVYIKLGHNINELLLSHSWYSTQIVFKKYTQLELEQAGAVKVINYVAKTGEITLYSNLDYTPDVFSLYQIFVIDKTQSDYATNPQYKLLTGSIIYENLDHVVAMRDQLQVADPLRYTFVSHPYYLGGIEVPKIQIEQATDYIYNYPNNVDAYEAVLNGTVFQSDLTAPIFSNHYLGDPSSPSPTPVFQLFVQPNINIKEDFQSPCVLNLWKQQIGTDYKNAYGYLTNSFDSESYDKYMSVDTLDGSQYLVSFYSRSFTLLELPAPASDFNYSIVSGGEVTITKYNGSDENVVIPGTIEGYPVTSINNNAFKECIVVQNIVIPDSLHYIGSSAFQGCTGLTKILIPPSVNTIHSDAFQNCNNLTICCDKDSTAYTYATNNGIPVELSDLYTTLYQLLFPQTAYKLYSYFVDSVPEQFFYYRRQREFEFSYKDPFTQEDIPKDLLWEEPYGAIVNPLGTRQIDEVVVGGTVAFNQRVNPEHIAIRDETDIKITKDRGIITITTTTSYQGGPFMIDMFSNFHYPGSQLVAGHKILIIGSLTLLRGITFRDSYPGSGETPQFENVTTGTIFQANGNPIYFVYDISVAIERDPARFAPMVIDLTQMFGPDIADYLYELERVHAGDGITYFRRYFPSYYYDYNMGEFMSVSTSAHKISGFNLLDKTKQTNGGGLAWATGQPTSVQNNVTTDFIRAVEGSYYTNYKSSCFAYDENKNYIGVMMESGRRTINGIWAPRAGARDQLFNVSGATYIRFVFRSGDNGGTDMTTANINVNISGTRNGQYEPYVDEKIYPLGNNLELRGLPKIANGELYYDGDEYYSDGKVKRRYNVINLQTASSSSFSTDGPNTQGNYRFWIRPQDKAAGFDILSSDTFTVSTTAIGPNVDKDGYISGADNSDQYPQRIYMMINGSKLDGTTYDLTDTTQRIAAFKEWLDNQELLHGHPTYILYRVDSETEENAAPFVIPQDLNDNCTVEYVDSRAQSESPSRSVIIPVGHKTYAHEKLKTRDIIVKASELNFSDRPFALPSIKLYRYYLYMKNGLADPVLVDESGNLYDGKLTYTFHGLESIYLNGTRYNVPEEEKIKYYVKLYVEDEYGSNSEWTEEIVAAYEFEDGTSSLMAGVDCNTQSINIYVVPDNSEENSELLNYYSLYRRKKKTQLWEYLGYFSLQEIQGVISDYNLQNGNAYEYAYWGRDSSQKYQRIASLGYLQAYWQDWSLCDLIYDYENQTYIPSDTVFLFRNNINAGSITKNISRAQYETLGRYQRVLANASRYESGNLTCLFGDFKALQRVDNNRMILEIDGEIPILNNMTVENSLLTILNSPNVIDDEDVIDFYRHNGFPNISAHDINPYSDLKYKDCVLYSSQLNKYYDKSRSPVWKALFSRYEFVSDADKIQIYQNCLSNKNKKLLKAPNGNSWIVSVSDNITREVDWKSGQYPTNIGFNWQEIEDINKVRILKW